MRTDWPDRTSRPREASTRRSRALAFPASAMLALALLLAGCAGGDDTGTTTANNGGEGCILDSECNLGQICRDNVCVLGTPGCSDDDDCDDGETCNVLTGECEAEATGCTSNRDCDAGEACNTATGECEAEQTGCTADTDCDGGEVCNTATGECETEQTGCTSDTDCDNGEVCNTATGECEIEQTRCANDTDCNIGESCNRITGECETVQTGCTADTDCDNGEVCNTATGECEAEQIGCTANIDCNEGEVCDTASGECVGCLTNADCTDANAPACDTAANTCVRCLADADCGEREICDVTNHACEPAPCATNADCTDANAPACDTTSGECVRCVADADCGEREICDVTNHACEPAPCAANADCTDANAPVCDVASGQCVACVADADCTDANASVCDVATNACVQCLDDADCSEPTPLCDTAANTCAGCLTNADCEANEVCNDGRVCEVVAACTNDGSEPNDTQANATALTSGQPFSGQVCATDVDTFAIALEANCEATVDLTFTHADGDLNLLLFDANGTELARSATTTDAEQLVRSVAQASTLYAVVRGASATTANAYQLQTTVTCQMLACPDSDDAFEPNDTLGEAGNNAALAPNEAITAILCSGADVYAIEPGEGCLLTADLTFSQATGDLDLFLVASNGAVIDSGISEDDDESVVGQATSAAPYFLVVQGFEGSTNTYGLQWEALCPTEPVACPADDPWEPNESVAAATILSGSDDFSAALCGADGVDFYAVTIPSGCDFDANVTFSQATGDLDLFLITADEFLIAASTTETDNEALAGTVALTDTYYFVVAGYQGSQNTYGFTLDVTCGPLACTDDDVFEPNDTLAESAILPDSAEFRAILCDAADTYAIFVGSHCTLEAAIGFDNAAGDLNLYLLDTAGDVIASSETSDDAEGFAGTSPLDSVVFISVEGASNTYDALVNVTCEAPTCPADDLLESGGNDARANAVLLPDDARFVATTCTASANDWYAFDAQVGCFVRVDASFDGAASDIDLYLHDPAGAQRTSSVTAGNDESVQLIANTAGTWTWRVQNLDANDATYNAEAHVNCDFATLACPADDAFEPNDTPDVAADLPRGAIATGITCGDSDWYVSDVFEGCAVTVNAWFMHAGGDLDLAVYDANGALIDFSDSSTNNETVTFTAAASGPIVVLVEGYQGAQNTYELSVTQVCN